jgi:hypothetical protein
MGKDEEKPFYLQLNETIFERVQREKAEQIKIQSLQQRTARGQFFATVFGIAPTDPLAAAHTNRTSLSHHRQHRLLLWPDDPP